MAVQQNRKSRSRRGMRRSHDRLRPLVPVVDAVTGEPHLRHHVSPEGWYRGRRVIEILAREEDQSEQER